MRTEIESSYNDDTVEAFSLDCDNCLEHNHYLNHRYDEESFALLPTDKLIIQNNQILLDHIKDRHDNHNPVTLYIGSNRQSLTDEITNCRFQVTKNGYIKESFFYAMQKIQTYIGCEFSPLLMPDIMRDRKIGVTYQKALKALPQFANKDNCTQLREWCFDTQKVTILFAQMQEMALNNPGKKIIFHFVDDRTDILENLYNFFNKYPNMVPVNLTLRLHQYNSNTLPRPFTADITGIGEPDKSYRNTVKTMVNIAKLYTQYDVETVENDVGKCVIEHSDKSWMPIAVSTSVSDSSSDRAKAIPHLPLFMVHMKVLRTKEGDLKTRNHTAASSALSDLINTLHGAVSFYSHGNYLRDLILSCKNAIQIARDSELQNHRGIKRFFCCTNTDSIKKINALDDYLTAELDKLSRKQPSV